MHSSRSASPFWLIVLLTVMVAGVTFSLGVWQMNRARVKEDRAASVRTASHAPAMDAVAWLATSQPAAAINQAINMRGQWLEGQTLFLDNRQMNGKPGFFVLTPFVLANGQAVVVQRGWVPRHFLNRTLLPSVSTPEGIQSFMGRVALPPDKLFEMGVDSQDAIRQNIDLGKYSSELKVKYGLTVSSTVSVIQLQGDEDGLTRQWTAPDHGVDRHYGYAFQWFGLSALTVFLFLWFQVFQPFKRHQAHRENPS